MTCTGRAKDPGTHHSTVSESSDTGTHTGEPLPRAVQTAAWCVAGDTAGAMLGTSMTGANYDGDEFSDILIGAPGPIPASAGVGNRAYLFAGGSQGLQAEPAWEAGLRRDIQVTASFGWAVAAGDLHGTGRTDAFVAAPNQDFFGVVYGYDALATGVVDEPTWTGTWSGDSYSSLYGWAVATVDIDGNGYDEVLVGAPLAHQGPNTLVTRQGIVAMYSSEGGEMGVAPIWVAESGEEDCSYGWAVANAGDMDGDGINDLAIGGPSCRNASNARIGRVDVFLGSSAGLSDFPARTSHGSNPADERWYGLAVAGGGDVDGDGYDDVVIGAPGDPSPEGEASLVLGSATGSTLDSAWRVTAPEQTFGMAVSVAGDVDGDGHHDVAVGARWFDDSFSDEGRVSLWLGHPGGLDDGAAWEVVGGSAGAEFGAAVVGVGDVDSDGRDDLAVGAPGWSEAGIAKGAVFLFGGAQAVGSAWAPEAAGCELAP